MMLCDGLCESDSFCCCRMSMVVEKLNYDLANLFSLVQQRHTVSPSLRATAV